MMLYTWKDVERKLLLDKDEWLDVIVDVEIYSDEVIIHLEKNAAESTGVNILKKILGEKYDSKKQKIFLDLANEYLDISFIIDESEADESITVPLFKNILYQNTAYYRELIGEELPGVPVLAFHSYKGGVGRTLSLLAFILIPKLNKNLFNSCIFSISGSSCTR